MEQHFSVQKKALIGPMELFHMILEEISPKVKERKYWKPWILFIDILASNLEKRIEATDIT